MANQWVWGGGQYFADQIISAPRTIFISNVTEDVVGTVTLIVANNPFKVGDQVWLSGLTTAPWLNSNSPDNQGMVTLIAPTTQTVLTFVDANFGTTGSAVGPAAETGQSEDGSSDTSIVLTGSIATNSLLSLTGSTLHPSAFVQIDGHGSMSIQQAPNPGATAFAVQAGGTTQNIASFTSAQTPLSASVTIDPTGHLNMFTADYTAGPFIPAAISIYGTPFTPNLISLFPWIGNEPVKNTVYGSSGHSPVPAFAVNGQGGLVITPSSIGPAMTTNGDYTVLLLASTSNAVSTALTLTSVAASTDGSTSVYTGTITGGANNAFANFSFVVSGFTNPANNTVVGTSSGPPPTTQGLPYSFFVCVASTATTLTLLNANAVTETHAATATYGSTIYTAPSRSSFFFSEGVQTLSLTSVAPLGDGTAVYTGNFAFGLGPAVQPLSYVTVYGCTNANNNGSYFCTESSLTSLTLSNPNATPETGTLTSNFVLTSVTATFGIPAVYTGTITGGGSNAFVGYVFSVTGFATPNNNGLFICIASTATTLTLVNVFGVTETHAANAQGSSRVVATFSDDIEYNLTSPFPFTVGSPVSLTGLTAATWLNGASPAINLLGNTSDSVLVSSETSPTALTVALSSVAASTTTAALSLTDVTLTLSPLFEAVYTGTITGGAANAYLGYSFTITGFSNSGNNLVNAICSGSTATTLIFHESTQTNETTSASATGSTAVYTGTIPGGGSNGVRGRSFAIGGFANASNNGDWICVASTTTTITLGNNAAVSETLATFGAYSSTPQTVASVVETGTVTGVIGTTNEWAGKWVTTNGWLNGFFTNTDTNNGTFFAIASDATSITLLNPIGVAQTQFEQFALLSAGSPIQQWFTFNNPNPVMTLEGNGTISLNGGVAFSIVTKGGNYTLSPNDYTVNANGTFTVTLPTTGLTVGQVFQIKNIGTGVITVSSSVNIDGTTSFNLATQYDSVTVQWDGTQYWIY